MSAGAEPIHSNNVRLCLCVLCALCGASCSEFPLPEFNNVTADENARLAKDPALASYLQQSAVPQDQHFHFAIGVTRLHDRTTGDPVGWNFTLSVCVSWPRFELPPVKRAIRISPVVDPSK